MRPIPDDSSASTNALPGRAPLDARTLGRWWRQGARSAFLRTPTWSALQTTPIVVACLVAVPFLLDVGLERLAISGPATFYWPAFQTGWWTTVLTLWICWIAARPGARVDPERATPSAAALFSMLAAQVLTI